MGTTVFKIRKFTKTVLRGQPRVPDQRKGLSPLFCKGQVLVELSIVLLALISVFLVSHSYLLKLRKSQLEQLSSKTKIQILNNKDWSQQLTK